MNGGRNDSRSGSLAASASRAVLWNVALIPVQGAVALWSSAAVARALSNDEYAVYGLALATLTSLLLWTDLGITPMVSRYAPLIRDQGSGALRSFFRKVVAVRAAVLVATLLLVPLAQRVSSVRELLPLTTSGLMLVLLALVGQGLARMCEYFLSGLLDRRSIGTARIVLGLAHPLLVIAAVTAGLGVPGILMAVALVSVLDVILFGSLTLRRMRSERAASAPAAIPPDIRAAAARFAAVSFLDKFVSHLNSAGFAIFLVAGFGLDAQVALLAVAGEFAARVLAVLAIPFSGLTLPLFATVEARRPADTGVAARLYLIVMILSCVPAAGLLWALAEPLVTLVYSTRYTSAAPILRAFVPFVFLEYAVYSAFLAPLLTRERFRAVLVSKAPLLIGVAAMFWTVPRWGAAGAALTYGISRAVSAALLLATGLRVLSVTFPLAFTVRVVAGTVAATVSASAVVRLGWAPGLMGAAAACVVGVLAFLAFYRLAGGMDASDKTLLAQGLAGAAPLDRLVTFIL